MLASKPLCKAPIASYNRGMAIASKTYTAEVICLKAIDFGEADKILHLYSPEVGRISAIAKGVKKAKSKLAGACELLNLSEVQLSRGKNLDVLCQYQPRQTFTRIRANLLKLAYAMLYAELINHIAAESDSHAVFDLLKTGLAELDGCPDEDTVITATATVFQVQVLESAGYHPELARCIFSNTPLDWREPFYAFSPELGGVTDIATRKGQPYGSHGSSWVNIATPTLRALDQPFQSDWPGDTALKSQKFLQYYFRHVFERPLSAGELVLNLLAPPQAP